MKLKSSRAGLAPRAAALEAIRARIASGQWPEGTELISERVMAEELGVARMTLRSALDELSAMGVIEPGRGKKRRVSRSRSALLAQTVGVISAYRFGPQERFFVESQDYFTQLSAEATIQKAGYHILVVHPDMLQGARWQELINNRPAGLLWTALPAEVHATQAVLEAEERASIPVTINSDNPAFSGVDRVVHDHESGGMDITRWLIAAGCRRLAAVNSMPHAMNWWQRRLQGARTAIHAAGLPPLREITCKVDLRDAGTPLTEEFFHRRVRQMVGFLVELFQGSDPVDGIISINDPDAIQIAAACRLLGREPGRDVRIAGYDNLWRYCPEFALSPNIPCVTVDKNNPAVGQKLASTLLQRISEPDAKHIPERFVVPHRLIAGSENTSNIK